MTSKSSGKDEARRITIRKVSEQKRIAGTEVGVHTEECFPSLHIGNRGIQALQKHVSSFPPNDLESMESYETGSSLIRALTRKQHDGTLTSDEKQREEEEKSELLQTLDAFNLTTTDAKPEEVASLPVIDVNQRIARHKQAQPVNAILPTNLHWRSVNPFQHGATLNKFVIQSDPT